MYFKHCDSIITRSYITLPNIFLVYYVWKRNRSVGYKYNTFTVNPSQCFKAIQISTQA